MVYDDGTVRRKIGKEKKKERKKERKKAHRRDEAQKRPKREIERKKIGIVPEFFLAASGRECPRSSVPSSAPTNGRGPGTLVYGRAKAITVLRTNPQLKL